MAESVVADFVAEVLRDDSASPEPVRSRVLLGEDRLVVASDDRQTTVPLDDVYDVSVSQVPEELADFLDQTVLVTYRDGEEGRRLIVSSSHDRIEKFASLLFKLLLSDARVTVRHPTLRGGRVLDPAGTPAVLQVGDDVLHLRGPDGDLDFDLDAVVHVVERTDPSDGSDVLEVQYVADGTVIGAELAADSARLRNVLRRYFRLRLFGSEDRVTEYDPADVEQHILAALYAGLGQEEIVELIEMDPTDVWTIVLSLEDESLVDDAAAGRLTDAGHVAVHEYFSGGA